MRAITTPAFLALSLAAAVVATSPGVRAQSATTPPAAAPQTPADAAVPQMVLTPDMIDQFVAAKKDMDSVLDKLPEGTDQPDPAMMTKLDATAKKYKFADYKQYDATESNIGIVMAGIDPTTKQYIGPEAVIKKQIAEVQADKQIAAADKKNTVDQLNSALASVPKLQYPANIPVVTKNFDRLNEAMPQD